MSVLVEGVEVVEGVEGVVELVEGVGKRTCPVS